MQTMQASNKIAELRKIIKKPETVLSILKAENIIEKDKTIVLFHASDGREYYIESTPATFRTIVTPYQSNEADIRKEVLFSVYPNVVVSLNEMDDYLFSLSDMDYLQFINRNTNRWELVIE